MQNKVFTIKRSIAALAAFLLIMLLTVTGCSNPGLTPGEVPGTNATGTVRFSWSDGEAGSRSRANNILDADKVVITIEAADGTVVYNQKQLKLYNFNGSFISEPLSLKVGNYKLTEYLILDSAGTVIFATPKAGSEQAHLVTMPLPHDFTVTKDGTTKVKPQVVDAAAVTPAEFGYTGFNFEEAKIFNFNLSVMIYDASTDGFILTDAALDVTTDAKAYNFALTNTTNSLAINDVAGNYTLTLKKSGYDEYRVSYTAKELKAFFHNPLTIVLTKTKDIITFGDPAFEAEIRALINHPTGDITPADVANLGVINIMNKNFTTLDGIERLTALRNVSIYKCGLTDISALAKLPALSSLNLGYNDITDLRPISGQTGLGNLFLTGNRNLTDISPLAGMTNLRYISIADTNVSDITALAGMSELSSISLGYNKITDISALAGKVKMKTLNLSNNTVSDITALANLPVLNYINLENNRVTGISAVENLPMLKNLFIRNNRITDLTPLLNNVDFAANDNLFVAGNPLNNHSQTVQIPAFEARGVQVR